MRSATQRLGTIRRDTWRTCGREERRRCVCDRRLELQERTKERSALERYIERERSELTIAVEVWVLREMSRSDPIPEDTVDRRRTV